VATLNSGRNESPNINELIGDRLTALAAKAPLFIGIGAVLTVVSFALNAMQRGALPASQAFFQSYLFAFMFWFGVTLGSTAWLLGHHVTGGGWGYLLRRPLEAATRNWPVVLAMWVPVFIAMLLSMANGHNGLYEWADQHLLANDHVLSKKVGYLNPIAWTVRALLYFVIWFVIAHLLNKWSRKEDETDDPYVRHNLSMWSAVGLIFYVITVTFATMDWVMTLEPHWYSSLFGAIFLVGQGHSTLCIMMILIKLTGGQTDLMKRVESRYFRDVGNLLLAFTLLWAYTNFSQFMIQYSANIAEEAEWFVNRTQYGWQFFGAGNIIMHFVLPFLMLLMSINKVNLNNFVRLAAFLLVVRHIDLLYYVVPTFRHSVLSSTPFSMTTASGGTVGAEYPWAFLADIGLPLLLGGIWILAWATQMKKTNAPLVPVYDARLAPYWPLEEGAEHLSPERHRKGVTAHG
jgi:hypothetical protein